MDLRRRSPIIVAAFCLVLIASRVSKSTALVATHDFNPPYPKAISVNYEIFNSSFFFGNSFLAVYLFDEMTWVLLLKRRF